MGLCITFANKDCNEVGANFLEKLSIPAIGYHFFINYKVFKILFLGSNEKLSSGFVFVTPIFYPEV